MKRLVSIAEQAGITDHPVRQTVARAISHNIIPSTNDLIRRHSYDVTEPELAKYDDQLLRCIGRLLNLSEAETKQLAIRLFLPIRLGGFGFVSFASLGIAIRLGALAASLLSVRDLLVAGDWITPDSVALPEINRLIERFKSQVQLDDPEDDLYKDLELLRSLNAQEFQATQDNVKTLNGLSSRLRRRVQTHVHKNWMATINDTTHLLIREKLNSGKAKESNVFLNAVLKEFRPHQIVDGKFIKLFRQRALLRVVPPDIGICPLCRDDTPDKNGRPTRQFPIDDYGEHLMKCPHFHKGAPHNGLQWATIKSFNKEFKNSLGLTIRPTPPLRQYKRSGVDLPKVDRQRQAENPQADICIHDTLNQTTVIIDIRTCAMQMPTSAAEIGISLKTGEQEKLEHYKKHYVFPEGVKFIPFAIDTHGRWNDAFKDYVKELCLRKAEGRVNSPVYSMSLANIIRCISIAHARAVGGRIEEALRRIQNRNIDVIPKLSVRGY